MGLAESRFLEDEEDIMKKFEQGVFILGAGGHAKVLASTMQEAGIEIAAFLDDDPLKWGKIFLGIPVIGDLDLLRNKGYIKAVIAIGDNQVRKEIAERFEDYCEWITVIHPQAYVHKSVQFEEGTVVFAGGVIQPDTHIGKHVIVNTGVTIDHDCELGDFVHLGPGSSLAGNVRVGEGCLIGIGGAVIPGKHIGKWSVIGAKAAVVKDIPNHVLAVGVPARIIKKVK